MIDPGALGTLLIGLRATRQGPDLDGPPSMPTRALSPTRWSSVRAAVSGARRSTSYRGEPVEPSPVAVGCGD
jgi:hypothetical protein